jgi:hypothetical protein
MPFTEGEFDFAFSHASAHYRRDLGAAFCEAPGS